MGTRRERDKPEDGSGSPKKHDALIIARTEAEFNTPFGNFRPGA
jgi:hypothetical protein